MPSCDLWYCSQNTPSIRERLKDELCKSSSKACDPASFVAVAVLLFCCFQCAEESNLSRASQQKVSLLRTQRLEIPVLVLISCLGTSLERELIVVIFHHWYPIPYVNHWGINGVVAGPPSGRPIVQALLGCIMLYLLKTKESCLSFVYKCHFFL